MQMQLFMVKAVKPRCFVHHGYHVRSCKLDCLNFSSVCVWLIRLWFPLWLRGWSRVFSFTNTKIHLNANIPREVAKNSPKEVADHKSRSDLKIPWSLEWFPGLSGRVTKRITSYHWFPLQKIKSTVRVSIMECIKMVVIDEWTRWEYPHGTGIEFHKATCTSTPGSHIGQNHGCLKLQLLIILRWAGALHSVTVFGSSRLDVWLCRLNYHRNHHILNISHHPFGGGI